MLKHFNLPRDENLSEKKNAAVRSEISPPPLPPPLVETIGANGVKRGRQAGRQQMEV